MPLTSILILTGIVSAFATFGIGLAWAERQTRTIRRVQPAAKDTVEVQDELKMAA